ncbi:hypothetical protein [Conexibacter sp. W3-3-2]|uniref:hypothetical protein n=1 Tax=Conexibacter sp. W3-3-2 TaxID=2675227 RepID=UPI0018ABD5E1|nr:hypothetical protein [Conexibacter sp. W3-3-2]
MSRRRTLLGALVAAGATALAAVPATSAQQAAFPIPGPLDGPLPRYTGAPATAAPLPGPFPPANPALAADGRSGSGLAAGNGAASPYPGPLGVGTRSISAFAQGGCSSLAFDARDRLLAVCSNPLGPGLRLFDPRTLATRASLALPLRPGPDRTDLAGGTHFVVRADGSLLVPTHARTLLRVTVEGDRLQEAGETDLGGALGTGERPFAVGAGFDGRDWVVGTAGTVVTVPRDGGPVRALALREPVAEDLATNASGTYVVTRDALYRLVARSDGTPRVVWRQPLGSGLADGRSGRIHEGPGTPPVMVAGGFVAVVDGLNPPRVTVLRTAGRDAQRLRCTVPVFRPGAGSVEAHLVAAGRSLVVSNAYGYQSLLTTEAGGTTTGGLARVVVGRRGCRVAWTSDVVTPSAQAVVSRATGLLYAIEKPAGFPDAWNLVALDWRTGARRFGVLAGEGLGFNSDGGAVVLGPDGVAYAGSFGGVTRFADAR